MATAPQLPRKRLRSINIAHRRLTVNSMLLARTLKIVLQHYLPCARFFVAQSLLSMCQNAATPGTSSSISPGKSCPWPTARCLLRGTGSNIYNANLVRALAGLRP